MFDAEFGRFEVGFAVVEQLGALFKLRQQIRQGHIAFLHLADDDFELFKRRFIRELGFLGCGHKGPRCAPP